MKKIFKVFAVGAMLALPLPVLAAIDGSHHDMTAYNGSREKCAYCHAKSGLTVNYAGYGQVGTFCAAVCHVPLANAVPSQPGKFGTGGEANRWVTSATVDAIGVVAFTASHGEATLMIPLPDTEGKVTGTNWPHVNEGDMQCTSCHAVHDSTNTPFLNAPLSGGTGVTGNADSFCQQCHAGSNGAGAGRYTTITGFGPHPTQFAYVDGASDRSATAGKQGRTMEVKAPLLRTGLKSGYADKAAFDADVSGNAWRTGGHFVGANGLPINSADSAGLAGTTFGCYSCHSAHQDNGTLNGQLILGDLDYVIGAGSSSNFCTGCHGATATPNNPGTTTYYHPTNEETASADGVNYAHEHAAHSGTGSFPIVVNTTGSLRGTTNNTIECTTCHDVHGGQAGHMSIDVIDATIQSTKDVCFTCHRGSMGSPTAAGWHHPGAAGTNYTSGGTDFPATLGWTMTGGYGNLADGLSCPDCHVFQANGTRRATAHNW